MKTPPRKCTTKKSPAEESSFSVHSPTNTHMMGASVCSKDPTLASAKSIGSHPFPSDE